MTAESADDKKVKHMMDTLALSQRLNFPAGTYPTTAVQKVSQYTCTHKNNLFILDDVTILQRSSKIASMVALVWDT